MSKLIFTVGHSNHPIDHFLELLKAHEINCVVDVRSIVASRFNPQYNGKALSKTLAENNIQYLHFAHEFGARQTDKGVLDKNGQVDFEKVQHGATFKSGVQRLEKGMAQNFKIALMCAEANPLDCHRFGMVACYLGENGFEVKHILKDKSLLDNAELEKQLLEKYAKKIPASGMFDSPPKKNEKLKSAYRLLNREIGYRADQ